MHLPFIEGNDMNGVVLTLEDFLGVKGDDEEIFAMQLTSAFN